MLYRDKRPASLLNKDTVCQIYCVLPDILHPRNFRLFRLQSLYVPNGWGRVTTACRHAFIPTGRGAGVFSKPRLEGVWLGRLDEGNLIFNIINMHNDWKNQQRGCFQMYHLRMRSGLLHRCSPAGHGPSLFASSPSHLASVLVHAVYLFPGPILGTARFHLGTHYPHTQFPIILSSYRTNHILFCRLILRALRNFWSGSKRSTITQKWWSWRTAILTQELCKTGIV